MKAYRYKSEECKKEERVALVLQSSVTPNQISSPTLGSLRTNTMIWIFRITSIVTERTSGHRLFLRIVSIRRSDVGRWRGVGRPSVP